MQPHVTTSLCASPTPIYTYIHTYNSVPICLYRFPSSPTTNHNCRNKGLPLFHGNTSKMARFLLVLFAACVLPAFAAARFAPAPFHVTGCVYCDTCRCGFETDATTLLKDALVRVECRGRSSGKITYTKEAVTDATGHYTVLVETDRGDDLCEVVLVKSSDPECSMPNGGRDRATVILTRNNGMLSNQRFANAMGFLKNTPLESCPQILLKYKDTEEDI